MLQNGIIMGRSSEFDEDGNFSQDYDKRDDWFPYCQSSIGK